jgi:hypothetical protein
MISFAGEFFKKLAIIPENSALKKALFSVPSLTTVPE